MPPALWARGQGRRTWAGFPCACLWEVQMALISLIAGTDTSRSCCGGNTHMTTTGRGREKG